MEPLNMKKQSQTTCPRYWRDIVLVTLKWTNVWKLAKARQNTVSACCPYISFFSLLFVFNDIVDYDSESDDGSGADEEQDKNYNPNNVANERGC